jgi:hypothetical protein
MRATIQKPIEEIVRFIRPGEKVFAVGVVDVIAH